MRKEWGEVRGGGDKMEKRGRQGDRRATDSTMSKKKIKITLKVAQYKMK